MIRPGPALPPGATALVQVLVPALALALSVIPATPLRAEIDALVLQAFEASRRTCAFMGAELGLPENPVTWVDLTGNGLKDDRIVEEGHTTCGPDFLHTGTVGAPVHAIIGDHVQTLRGPTWALSDVQLRVGDHILDPVRVLINGVHGSACGGSGATACMVLYLWDGRRLVSIEDGMAP